MSQVERFAILLRELERVGVDPNTISAGLAVREQDVLRALAILPDQAGPTEFLARLREITLRLPDGDGDGDGAADAAADAAGGDARS